MQTPSRFIPSFPEKNIHPVVKWTYGTIFYGLVMVALIASPIFTSILIFLIVASTFFEKRRIKHLANLRSSESICTFARSVNIRQLDTHVVRAVYEEFGAALGSRSTLFPLHITDCLFESKCLNFDPDDVDDILIAAAYRANKSLKHTESNPYYGKVKTIGDIISFLMAQPDKK